MSDNLKDILSHLSTDIDQETLLLYLQDKLSAEKKHEVEKKLLENEFAGDALEGLQQFQGKEKLSGLVDQLNLDLKNKLKKKKKRREDIHIRDFSWIYIAAVLIILLIIISYIIIHRMLQHPLK
jgi:hypothetical protein